MKKSTLVLCSFIVLKFVLQYLVVNPVYELHRDEYLHLDQAKHLAWGFHSVPPVTSWVSWLILQLGNSYFWVKFFPALFGALTILVVWKTIESLKGNLFACILAATALLFSVLVRINILYQPNSLDILCWTLVYYTLIRYSQTQDYKWAYFMAICFAIGFLNKYNIAFCAMGLIPGALLSEQRKLFFRPKFFLALILALALISPNLIWQWQNEFPVIDHMKELKETQLVHVSAMDFVREQFFFFIGSLFIIIIGFISFFVYQPFKRYRFLFFAYVFTIVLFVYFNAKGYYAIGLYPIFFAFGSIYIGRLLAEGWKYKLRYVAVAIIILLFIPISIIALPLETPAKYAEYAKQHKPFSEHKWEDGRTYPIAQDFADMLGWEELARKTDSLYKNLNDPEHTFILCDNYGQAAAINYYTKIKGLQANSFSTDYDRWMDLETPIRTMIRIKEFENKSLVQEQQIFEKITLAAEIENEYAREKGTQVLILELPKIDINKGLKAEINRRNN